MKRILTVLFIMASMYASAQNQEKKDSANNVPVLSMNDMLVITGELQYLPAKDWLKICQTIEQVYFRKLNEMKQDQKKEEPKRKK